MATCSNCKTKMSCGCQKRNSSTGVVGCTSCITDTTNTKKNTTSSNTNNALKRFWGPEIHSKVK